jgi:hypothetical protein
MKKKTYKSKVADLGCLICGGHAVIHHCETYMGGGRDDNKIIPLCHAHHTTGGYGVAFHAGKAEWQKIYGTEKYFLNRVEELLK